MTDLFVYSWFYTGYTVYGHCLDDNGKYVLLTVNGFHPYCYVEGTNVPRSNVVPEKVIRCRMATSRNVSVQRSFIQVFFRNKKDLDAFASEVRCYMADVQPVSMFLSQIRADYVGWVHVPSITVDKPEDISPVSQKDPYANPRVFVFDIEVKSCDSGMPKPHRLDDEVKMISVLAYDHGRDDVKKYMLHVYDFSLEIQGVEDVMCSDEMDLIQKFFRLMKDEDPTVITGFNIFGFDIAYLVSRLRLRLRNVENVARGHKGTIQLIKVDWQSDAYGQNRYERLVISGRVILDMFLYFRRSKLDKYSLDFVSHKFLNEGKHGMPYVEMAAAFVSKDRDALIRVAEYCIQDSVLVMRLFDKVQMWIDACEVAKITNCGIEDIYTRGEQMKMVSQCVRECFVRNIVLQPQPPSSWEQYEGAYVMDPVKGLYENCALLDFQSLYPSIIIAFNICPSTYAGTKTFAPHHKLGNHCFLKTPIGLLPGMIQRVLDERKSIKKEMKSCEKSSIQHVVFDRRQNALKICANSVYGMMGFQNSRYFGHLGCAESVTSVGRELLEQTICKIERDFPVRVIYGDTDSCMVWFQNTSSKDETIEISRKICEHITSGLPTPMALMFESHYDKVVLLSKKRYILVENGHISYKGVMNARRDYCKYAKNVYTKVIEMIAEGKSSNEITDYIDDRVLCLYGGRCDVTDLIITKSLARDLHLYKVNQPHVVLARRLSEKNGKDITAGTRLEYVFVKGSDVQADKMKTPEEFKDENLEVDGMFYIVKQLVTQVDDVLSVVGLDNYIRDNWTSLKKKSL